VSLPESDIAYLTERAIVHTISIEANMTCVVLPNWSLPTGYGVNKTDLLLRLSPGYPDVPPDCWWFNPAVRLDSGVVIPATEVDEHHLGKSWQRWSRHFNEGQWRSGVDGLESFIALIRAELVRSVPASVQ